MRARSGRTIKSKIVLGSIATLSKSPQIRALVRQLEILDEEELRPLDTSVLELLGAGQEIAARTEYFTKYEPARNRYEALLENIEQAADAAAQTAARDLAARNQASLRNILIALGLGILFVIAAAREESARRAAESANLTKSQFLANMSHELRTPLNAILGFSELLIAEMDDQGIHEWDGDLQKIQRAGNHLSRLINDILDLSKIEAGKMQLSVEDFDISVVVRDVVASLEPLAAKNKNRIEAFCEPAILRGDAMRVEQCLFNLIGNACKFTKRGRVLIHVQQESGVAGLCYRICIRDSGIGITREQLAGLFTAFSQGDGATTRKFGGSGLGLTISRSLCRMMGGDITVESIPGQGSTFIMRIPGSIATEEKTNGNAKAGRTLGNSCLNR